MTAGRPVAIYHCPFCAEEDLRPSTEGPDAWACGACARVFTVRLVRLAEENVPQRATSADTDHLKEPS